MRVARQKQCSGRAPILAAVRAHQGQLQRQMLRQRVSILRRTQRGGGKRRHLRLLPPRRITRRATGAGARRGRWACLIATGWPARHSPRSSTRRRWVAAKWATNLTARSSTQRRRLDPVAHPTPSARASRTKKLNLECRRRVRAPPDGLQVAQNRGGDHATQAHRRRVSAGR